MLVKTYSAIVQGIDAVCMTIEANFSFGLSGVCMVGLPDNAVKESEQRIRSSLSVNGYRFPNKGIVINMAPADIRKEGAAYDLPIAISIMAADEQVLTSRLEDFMLIGELSLDGGLQPIKGALPIAIKAKEMGMKGIILPLANAQEAAVVSGLKVYGMLNIRDVVRFLNGDDTTEPTTIDINEVFNRSQQQISHDFSHVHGQAHARRALEVAAAGGHNLIMVGPPGSGKSMMAKCLPGILPPLTLQEALETTKIHSVSGTLDHNTSLITQRPFRAPHHTTTDVSIVGGGTNPMPGEISLAHNGVLFLDELPEYRHTALEVMRQPLEDRKIRISRSKMSVEYPASFTLVAAMNPCPCGHYNDPTHPCTCPPGAVKKYMSRISGPLLDRIDIQIEVPPVSFAQMHNSTGEESSEQIRQRVVKAREIQSKRFENEEGIYCNAQMSSQLVRRYCQLDAEGSKMLNFAMNRLGFSARAYDRIMKVSRTIADLEGAENIMVKHISEAIGYRNLDRENWGG